MSISSTEDRVSTNRTDRRWITCLIYIPALLLLRPGSNERDSSYATERSSPVMLSAVSRSPERSEGSGSTGGEILRFAQHDSQDISPVRSREVLSPNDWRKNSQLLGLFQLVLCF